MLPTDLEHDADRLLRFEQEAKATSALNHPNILTVYDIGEENGSRFMVSELLVGEELRERLDEGPIPLRKTIDYAQQIVAGLAAAHERGITHRDLKPENLFITQDDRVKILDFGLAKLREANANIYGSEDATKRALTDPGVVMGTVGYMSPEQVRGHNADHRSDIFSFGIILYEMLSGRRAFGGDSVVETMHSILKEDVPDLDDSGIRIPPALDKLMRRCLEKKPEHRFHSAHDLGFALDAIASPTSSSGSSLTIAARSLPDVSEPDRRGWLNYAAWAVAALLLVTTIVFAALYFRREAPRAQTLRFALFPPDKNTFSEAFALAPDGKLVVFVARAENGVTALWVRPFNAVESRQLPGTEGAAFPFWSPDSRSIGFYANGKLRKIDAAGGPPQTIAEATGDTRGGTWLPDGSIIFSPGVNFPLLRVSSSGGTVTEVTKLDTALGQTSHRWPSVLPDGRHVLYFGRGGPLEKQGIYVTSIDSPDPKLLVQTMDAGAYTEVDGAGYLLFIREDTLMAQPLSASRMTLTGEATPLVEGVLAYPGEVGPTAFAAFSAAAGNLLYRTGDLQTTRLTWYDRTGKMLEAITSPGGYHEPVLTKDGTKLLYGRNEAASTQDVYLQDLVRGSSTRLTFDPAADSGPIFSPDETQIVFSSARDGRSGIYIKPSSGASSERLLITEPVNAYPDSWSSDGRHVLYDRTAEPALKVGLWVLPMTGDQQPFAYIDTQFTETHAQFSPDGRWVAYTSDESGQAEVYVQSFPIGGGKWQISNAGGDQPQWRGDGKELFYLSPDRKLMSVEIQTTPAFNNSRPQALFEAPVPLSGINDDRTSYAPARDGQRFILNALADTANEKPLMLVLNWANELKK
jgi:Tol biopolymer transport system component